MAGNAETGLSPPGALAPVPILSGDILKQIGEEWLCGASSDAWGYSWLPLVLLSAVWGTDLTSPVSSGRRRTYLDHLPYRARQAS